MKIIDWLRRSAEGNRIKLGDDGRMHCHRCGADMTGSFTPDARRVKPRRCPACGTLNTPISRPLFSP